MSKGNELNYIVAPIPQSPIEELKERIEKAKIKDKELRDNLKTVDNVCKYVNKGHLLSFNVTQDNTILFKAFNELGLDNESSVTLNTELGNNVNYDTVIYFKDNIYSASGQREYNYNFELNTIDMQPLPSIPCARMWIPVDSDLITAINKNKGMKVLRKLIRRCNVNKVDCNGNTALHLAIINKRYKLAEYLIYKRAKSNIQNHFGNTPLKVMTLNIKRKDFNQRVFKILVNENRLKYDEFIHILYKNGNIHETTFK